MAAWHGEARLGECAVEDGSEHLVHGPAEEGCDANPCTVDAKLQWGRDGSADQQIDAAGDEFGGASGGVSPDEVSLRAPDLAAILDVHQQEVAGDIEDGRDAPLPLRNRDSHHRGDVHLADQTLHGRKQRETEGDGEKTPDGTLQNAMLCARGHCKVQYG